MSKREHLHRGEEYEELAYSDEQLNGAFRHLNVAPIRYPLFLEGEWHDVTDALMALYHYVLAFAPQEEE